jgi:N-acetylglucosamine kinase-like BadF-type ATPase
MSLLGIDVGTSACRAAAFSEGGECLASANREYATLHPVFRRSRRGIRRIVKANRVFDPDPIRHRIYQQKLEAYGELFPLLQDFLARLEKREPVRRL